MLTNGSLFAGIGGFELGFERAGIKTIWQVEIDDYCRRVLARHFPDAQRFGDIRECGKHNLRAVDILSGGFPCQDISNAGKRAGIDGERSGLWSEYARIIRELRPRFVVVENVAALLGRGMGRVLGDLAACGYDAEWQSIRASDVGAPHRRERIWIVAYPKSDLRGTSGHDRSEPFDWCCPLLADASGERLQERVMQPGISGTARIRDERQAAFLGCVDVADSKCKPTKGRNNGLERWQRSTQESARNGWTGRGLENDWWAVEPDMGRVAHGVPARVDRLRGLGNAIVPQISEWIGRRIVEACE